jgi:mannose-6-phosphate isomerase-like protein (cupin superfamily)
MKKESETMPSKPFVELRNVEGVQHCHGDHCDEYYYRPLVYGKELFTYVAHIPPGGGVPPSAEEAKMFEVSLYILAGQPLITYGDEKFTMDPHTALHGERGVPIGLENPGEEPVSLVLSFAPPPKGATNSDEMRQSVESRGRSVFSPAAMNEMAGILLA